MFVKKTCPALLLLVTLLEVSSLAQLTTNNKPIPPLLPPTPPPLPSNFQSPPALLKRPVPPTLQTPRPDGKPAVPFWRPTVPTRPTPPARPALPSKPTPPTKPVPPSRPTLSFRPTLPSKPTPPSRPIPPLRPTPPIHARPTFPFAKPPTLSTNPHTAPMISQRPPTTPLNPNKVQVGTYVPNWFVYKKHYMGVEKMNVFDQKVRPEDSKQDYVFFPGMMRSRMSQLTHLYYAFLDLDPTCVVVDADPDASWYGAMAEPSWITIPSGSCMGLLNDMMALKSEYGHLKLMLSLGGWTYSKSFSACTRTAEKRKKIYDTFDFYVRQMDAQWGKSTGLWSGVDFDWEFPEVDEGKYPDHHEDDWHNYVKLIEEFRQYAKNAGRDAVVITSAIGLGNTMHKLVGKPKIARTFCDSLDYVNLMMYDFHGKWDYRTGHNAPFCPDGKDPNALPSLSSRRSVLETFSMMASVCSPSKLTMGLPNYSPGWTNIPASNNGLYQASSVQGSPRPEDGDARRWSGWSTFADKDDQLLPQGILSYWDIKDTLRKYSDFKIYSRLCDPDFGVTVPVKHIYSAERKAFACYDDEEVMQKKVEWARAVGMGGFFFWDMQQDKEGELLQAARSGWPGLPTFTPTGQRRCFDSSKPDFSLDPETGRKFECVSQGRELSFGGALSTCSAMKIQATQACGDKLAIATGGQRPGDGRCLMFCNQKWGSGENVPWVSDKVFYKCEGESSEQGAAVVGGNVALPGNSGCQTSGRSIVVQAGHTCNILKGLADQQCGGIEGSSQFVGADRPWQGCQSVCSADWKEGMVSLWVQDTAFFRCRA